MFYKPRVTWSRGNWIREPINNILRKFITPVNNIYFILEEAYEGGSRTIITTLLTTPLLSPPSGPVKGSMLTVRWNLSCWRSTTRCCEPRCSYIEAGLICWVLPQLAGAWLVSLFFYFFWSQFFNPLLLGQLGFMGVSFLFKTPFYLAS